MRKDDGSTGVLARISPFKVKWDRCFKTRTPRSRYIGIGRIYRQSTCPGIDRSRHSPGKDKTFLEGFSIGRYGKYAPVTEAWTFSGKKYGWKLALMEKRKPSLISRPAKVIFGYFCLQRKVDRTGAENGFA